MNEQWTKQELEDIAAAAPELTGVSKDEMRRLAQRYPTDDRLRALAAGRVTSGAMAAAVQDEEEQRAARFYERLRRSAADLAKR